MEKFHWPAPKKMRESLCGPTNHIDDEVVVSEVVSTGNLFYKHEWGA
jgi:hypothetical protein